MERVGGRIKYVSLLASRRRLGAMKVSFGFVGEGWGVMYKLSVVIVLLLLLSLAKMVFFGIGMREGKDQDLRVMSPRRTRGRKRAKMGSEQSIVETAEGWRSSSSQIQRREQGRFWV